MITRLCTVEEVTLHDDRGFPVDGVTATCPCCGSSTESFGTSEASVRRCLALLRDRCPNGAESFFVADDPSLLPVGDDRDHYDDECDDDEGDGGGDFNPTTDQRAALNRFERFARGPDVAFLLDGPAGTGKTYVVAQVLRQHSRGVRVAAAATHKAVAVLRRKLSAAGVPWCRDAFRHDGRSVIASTTAALLGIRPVVRDDETGEEERAFGRSGEGILDTLSGLRLLVIDEASMLAHDDLVGVLRRADRVGAKVLVVGDAAQLPPVKAQPIQFDAFEHRATLRQIVRQDPGALGILAFGQAVREGRSWRSARGPGLERAKDVVGAFLAQVEAPGELPEEERSTFVAYTNRTVDRVQELACRKVYGHGHQEFAPGELVLASAGFCRDGVPLCFRQDELIIEGIEPARRDPMLGVPVRLRRLDSGCTFEAHLLSPAERRDPNHPHAVELRRLSARANALQAAWKAPLPQSDRAALNEERLEAWETFWAWKTGTVIGLRHAFAITSHKSQGSTYRAVYADALELERFSRSGLYVAATRPRQLLVVPRTGSGIFIRRKEVRA